jgi:hypothetical protein
MKSTFTLAYITTQMIIAHRTNAFGSYYPVVNRCADSMLWLREAGVTVIVNWQSGDFDRAEHSQKHTRTGAPDPSEAGGSRGHTSLGLGKNLRSDSYGPKA